MTAEEAYRFRVMTIEESVKVPDLIETFDKIQEFVRDELFRAHDALFARIDSAEVPISFVIKAFDAEITRAENTLVIDLKDALCAIAEEPTKRDVMGSPIAFAGQVKHLLTLLFRCSSPGFISLSADLELINRLAPSIRNSLAFAIDHAYENETDAEKALSKYVEQLWYTYADYERAFLSPEKRKILADPSRLSIAHRIFDPVENMDRRPFDIVQAASRMPEPDRGEVLSNLRWAFCIRVLLEAWQGEPANERLAKIFRSLAPCVPFIARILFSEDEVVRLEEWKEDAKAIAWRSEEVSIQEQIEKLNERIRRLELLLSTSPRDQDDKEKVFRILLENILLATEEATTHPRGRWLGRSYSVVGNYCQLLWEQNLVQAFGKWGDADKLEEWEWLELLNKLVVLRLRLGNGSKLKPFGWKH